MRYLAACRRWAVLGLLFLPSAAFAVTDVNIQITSHGDPLPGATVTLMDASGTQVVAEAEDDDRNGVVVFSGIAEGRYQVAVTAPDGAVSTSHVDVPAEGAVTIGVTVAIGLSYNYVEFGYVADGDIDDDVLFGSDGERSAKGYTVQASHGFGRYFFVRGDALLLDVDSPFSSEVTADWLSAGPGARLPLMFAGRPLDLWGQASADRLAIRGNVFSGWGVAAGMRFGATDRLELNTWYKYADTDDEDDFDLTPQMYGVGLVYRVSPAVALTAAYAEGELKEENGATERSDFDLFTVGLRLDYDAGRPASMPPANANGMAVSYDYIQVAYPLDGELDTPFDNSDVEGGLVVSGYRQITDRVIFGGGAWGLDHDFMGSHFATTDLYYIGPGLRFGDRVGGAWVDVYGQVSYDRLGIEGDMLDGAGGKLGVRVRPHRLFEVDGWYKYSDVSRRNTDVEADIYGLSLIGYVCPHVGLEFGYVESDIEIRQADTTDWDLDFTYVGVRLHY